jgi:hypothetical protein
MYLKFGKDEHGSYTIKIPDDIVRKKDCAAYKAWAERTGPAFFAQNACPWKKPLDINAIGKFIVNDIKFNVPRKYLYLENISGGTEDGNQNELSLAFIYPDITPLTAADWSKVNQYEINLNIKNSVMKGCSTIGQGKQCDRFLYEYQNHTNSTMDRVSGAQPLFMKKMPELSMNEYSWINEYGFTSGFYIRGDDPWHPAYWMQCAGETCEAFMNYADNRILIRYTFHIDTLLTRHDELRNKIIALLDEWSGQKVNTDKGYNENRKHTKKP